MGKLQQWAARLAVAGFQSRVICRGFDWLAAQRRRVLRRQVEKRLRERGLYGDEVVFGPFRGLRFDEQWVGSRFEKTIGAYEAELHAVVEGLCARPYTDIINVGCAEGFYAIGLARRIPDARVWAYDSNPRALEQCRKLARLNEVAARIELGGFCDIDTLNNLPLRGRTLIVCDCEGYELDLLNPAAAPRLKNADILVELHDFKNRSISPVLRQRFAATHDLAVIQNEGLVYSHYPILRQLTFAEIYAMVGEERLEIMEWFWLTAKSWKTPQAQP